VSHLTSLVLIDEAGAQRNTLPLTRKVPLATPAIAGMYALSVPMMRASVCPEFSLDSSDLSFDLTPASNKESADALRDRFDELAAKIDWSNASVQLANGQLTILPAEIVNEIQAFAQ
jgi:hypothetical protein